MCSNTLARVDVYELEEKLYQAGYDIIAGVDEVGRGSLAGPLVAAAVILRKGERIEGIRDSKTLNKKRRAEFFGLIVKRALCWTISWVEAKTIDEISIDQANLLVMKRSVLLLEPQPQVVLSDSYRLPGLEIIHIPVLHGDSRSASIAAASIVAKEIRDKIMINDKAFPGYFFAQHKGYGTELHRQAITRLGACSIHRLSYGPFSRRNKRGPHLLARFRI
ncbi:ribonuclease HII [Candidatus Hakubella thermalkaliphila]|uniref:Ribonuclease n=1 Tax=Candidatus Hakubella thermalkaliphila TaxID=2754717 RepID=A0A6V8PX87_9ACTN|nr:ribonuclease HII [Candidatus Hakubella thermalkaliphila]GFP29826.1 ribonuclease HII [Candidatus Hakubella thermalkaliphila]GFP37192.1 ribonuclease HII [Candidatus Hakubella thermalkaliphila]GFP38825.1 ribonuclease HII [Candidatus Hakubella thermalkaliphila]